MPFDKKAYMKIYNASAAGQAAKRKHAATEKCKRTTKAYRRKNLLQYALHEARYRAERGGYKPIIESTIRFPMPKRCEHCGHERRLCIDHDHKTGKFRGWLCNRCNTAFGTFGDSVAGLRRAIKYLTG
jgi:hypothetical protein